ncbi:hypothetical protein M407DRAFT_247179 [Tulasnella calospora MUT 4182]|uniref:Uncharacterized protein n=1 Tax=Tulasnella calospora MUT 4182 TaxID=1051891 RepID=A0A0C3Q033_9AGAM|nr:hypothetical protein M407DRAFT_247179 [Tulasnella calospora MUT 4182]
MDSSIVGGPKWECCRTEPFVIPSYGLTVDGTKEAGDGTEEAGDGTEEARKGAKEAREKTKAALRIVLEMLLHWTCEERATIVQNAS